MKILCTIVVFISALVLGLVFRESSLFVLMTVGVLLLGIVALIAHLEGL